MILLKILRVLKYPAFELVIFAFGLDPHRLLSNPDLVAQHGQQRRRRRSRDRWTNPRDERGGVGLYDVSTYLH